MKFSRTAAFFCFFAICFVVFSCSRNDSTPQSGKSESTNAAPDFSLKDLRGNTIHLAELRGKVVLLEFWATWCPPCKAAIPKLNRLHEKYSSRNLVILAISLDQGQNIVRMLSDYVSANTIMYPVLIGDSSTADSYHVRSIPAIFLIGRDGAIAANYSGYSDELGTIISEKIEALL